MSCRSELNNQNSQAVNPKTCVSSSGFTEDFAWRWARQESFLDFAVRALVQSRSQHGNRLSIEYAHLSKTIEKAGLSILGHDVMEEPFAIGFCQLYSLWSPGLGSALHGCSGCRGDIAAWASAGGHGFPGFSFVVLGAFSDQVGYGLGLSAAAIATRRPRVRTGYLTGTNCHSACPIVLQPARTHRATKQPQNMSKIRWNPRINVASKGM